MLEYRYDTQLLIDGHDLAGLSRDSSRAMTSTRTRFMITSSITLRATA